LTKKIISIIFVITSFIYAKDIIQKESRYEVNKTVSEIEKIVTSKGMSVFAVIDHKAAAESVNMNMHDSKVIIFGNPKIDARIMLKDERAALDLPFKILIYKDANGKTQILYSNPQTLKKRYDLKECQAIDMMEAFLNTITNKVGKK